ncbi:hypothetical protein PsorP6_015657 [Peronosclerospora sorghi]|uniref:Uncharacterized protein n=1 Tax=Peronosclerospora sorghi TaxID=230839 RepID=A0ACC0WLT8_9STRA|nr:hypothetical protein PsorP6_015657 [Peronosclerospora sorghi]
MEEQDGIQDNGQAFNQLIPRARAPELFDRCAAGVHARRTYLHVRNRLTRVQTQTLVGDVVI